MKHSLISFSVKCYNAEFWLNHSVVCIESSLSAIENEEEDFRQKIEKLREHAGDSWLTFYNEMGDENEVGCQVTIHFISKLWIQKN